MPIKSFLVGGRLRALWCAALFFLLIMYALPWALGPLTNGFANVLHLKPTLNAAAIAFYEGALFITALIATSLFALFERKRPDNYGLPIGKALGANTWEGMAVGFVSAGAVGLGMLAMGGMQVHGISAGGASLARSALVWFGACVVVGIAEEFAFRAYLLQSLRRSIGFWPAAVTTTAIFVALHYFYKPGENIWDVVSLSGLALLLCFSLLRTGTLWFAVGFHIAFDFAQFFVIGTPNGGQIPEHRLFDVGFAGPAWLTGGSLGTEASVLMYPLIAALWIYVAIRFRGAPPTQSVEQNIGLTPSES